MPTDDLYHMNQLSKGASHGYQLGTELNKIIAAGRTKVLSECTFAEGTNDATVKTTKAMAYMIDGVIYSKAATDNVATGSATAQATGTYAAYVGSINSTGTVAFQKAADGSTEAAALAGIADLTITATSAPFGILVVYDSADTWTLGTDDLTTDATSFTIYDIVGVSPTELAGDIAELA